MDGGILFCLMYLKAPKEVKFTHHAYLKFALHKLCKHCSKCLISSSKDYVINIDLNYENMLLIFLEKQSIVNLSSIVPMT